jgi:SpoIIAA-like
VQMSGLPNGVHGLDARGTVTAADYDAVFAPVVDQLRQNGRRLRLLYQFGPSFNRITAGALWADSRLGARYLPLMDGCALVTDIDWIQAPGRGIATWLPCPMRVYDNAHRADAACWLEGLTAGVHPSVAQTAKAYIGGTGGATFSIAKLLLSRRFRRSDR